MNAKLDLSGFTGSERWFKHQLVPHVTYTEGVQYVAETAGAYWLLDIIATNQIEGPVSKEPFQVWKLVVADSKGVVTCDDGDGNIVHTQTIDFTDFPEEGVTLWFTNNVILLSSEY
jgi:hypothetical protein